MIDWQGIMDYSSLLLGVVVTIILGIIGYLMLHRGLLKLKNKKQLSETVYKTFQSTGRWLIMLLVILFTLQQLGVEVSSILSALLGVAAMVAVGFIAVWSVLSNLLCALLLIIFKPFQLNDEIEITEPMGGSSLRGKVVGLNIMYTTLLEKVGDEEMMTNIPNNVFFQKAVRRRNSPAEAPAGTSAK